MHWLTDFTPAIDAPAAIDAQTLWFVFHDQRLLLLEQQDQLPQAATLEQLGLTALRSQYLGHFAGGRHCFSVELDAREPLPAGFAALPLRHAFGRLPDAQFGVAARAIQIMNWERSNLFCGHCGTPTERRSGERVRVCPACGQMAFPRLAPAIMVQVRRGNELLLARSPHFPPGMYSSLAGFVEPGETLEQTVAREVREEVGIEVANLRYFGSQSWPFPHSMMIAFIADYAGGELAPDGIEIESAAYYRVDALPTLPGPISIAHHLIQAVIAEIQTGA